MLAWVALVIVVLLFAVLIGAFFGDDHYEPMPPEEEKRWLMEECNLTEEEADYIMTPIGQTLKEPRGKDGVRRM